MIWAMAGELDHEESLLWNDDDQSWAFPILAVEENGGKLLIESGKILMGAGAAEEKPNEEAPPPPPTKANKKKNGGKRGGDDDEKVNEGKGGGGGGGDSDDHELHIWTERERRKKMRNMFSSLHALIPHLHPRADKSTTVDEAVLYIKKLQLTLDNLEKQKALRDANITACGLPAVTQPTREAFLADHGSTSQQPPVTQANPNPVFPGQDRPAFRTWTSPNVVLNICGNDAHFNVCSSHKPGIFTALLFVMEKYQFDVVSAQVSTDRDARMYMIHARANGVQQQFPAEAAFLVEETYKQAAAELMLWVNS